MDQELIAYFDERFSETAQQIEALRSDLRLVATGVLDTSENLQVLKAKMDHELKKVYDLISRSQFQALENRIHRLEAWRESREIRERDPFDIIREKFRKTL